MVDRTLLCSAASLAVGGALGAAAGHSPPENTGASAGFGGLRANEGGFGWVRANSGAG